MLSVIALVEVREKGKKWGREGERDMSLTVSSALGCHCEPHLQRASCLPAVCLSKIPPAGMLGLATW